MNQFNCLCYNSDAKNGSRKKQTNKTTKTLNISFVFLLTLK